LVLPVRGSCSAWSVQSHFHRPWHFQLLSAGTTLSREARPARHRPDQNISALITSGWKSTVSQTRAGQFNPTWLHGHAMATSFRPIFGMTFNANAVNPPKQIKAPLPQHCPVQANDTRGRGATSIRRAQGEPGDQRLGCIRTRGHHHSDHNRQNENAEPGH